MKPLFYLSMIFAILSDSHAADLPPASPPATVHCKMLYQNKGMIERIMPTQSQHDGEYIGVNFSTEEGSAVEYWSKIENIGCVDCQNSWGHDFRTSLKFTKSTEERPRAKEAYGLFETVTLNFEESSDLKLITCQFGN